MDAKSHPQLPLLLLFNVLKTSLSLFGHAMAYASHSMYARTALPSTNTLARSRPGPRLNLVTYTTSPFRGRHDNRARKVTVRSMSSTLTIRSSGLVRSLYRSAVEYQPESPSRTHLSVRRSHVGGQFSELPSSLGVQTCRQALDCLLDTRSRTNEVCVLSFCLPHTSVSHCKLLCLVYCNI